MTILPVPDAWWTAGVAEFLKDLEENQSYRIPGGSAITFYFRPDHWSHIKAYGGKMVMVRFLDGKWIWHKPQVSIFDYKPHVAFDDDSQAALFRLTYL